jgi:hypothetical protein
MQDICEALSCDQPAYDFLACLFANSIACWSTLALRNVSQPLRYGDCDCVCGIAVSPLDVDSFYSFITLPQRLAPNTTVDKPFPSNSAISATQPQPSAHRIDSNPIPESQYFAYLRYHQHMPSISLQDEHRHRWPVFFRHCQHDPLPFHISSQHHS